MPTRPQQAASIASGGRQIRLQLIPRLFRAEHSKRASARIFFLFSPSISSAQALKREKGILTSQSGSGGHSCHSCQGWSSVAATTGTAQTHDPGYRCLPTLSAAKIPDNRVVDPDYPPRRGDYNPQAATAPLLLAPTIQRPMHLKCCDAMTLGGPKEFNGMASDGFLAGPP